MQDENSLVEYGFRRVVVTITAILCALLEIIDTTIVNVALNDMRGSLGATLTDVAWVITAYAIANVIIIPMTSWLSKQFGRRNYFAASIIIFTIASFLCGNATNIWELVLFRFIQGMGGGALLVTAQTIITESYPVEKRGMAQAIYGMGVIVGPTLGPPLGGYLVDHFSWPYIFLHQYPDWDYRHLYDDFLCKESKIWGKAESQPGGLVGNHFTGYIYWFTSVCAGTWSTG